MENDKKPIYFSKVEYVRASWMYGKGRPLFRSRAVMILNLVSRELSVQVVRAEPDMADMIYRIEAGWRLGIQESETVPLTKIRNSKTGMKSVNILSDVSNEKIISSEGTVLTDEQMQGLYPYCNALEFEPYRNRKMDMKDPGWQGYRDEITVSFKGITDSYISKIELPMDYLFDDKHTWPSERLYDYLLENYIRPNKKMCKAWWSI